MTIVQEAMLIKVSTEANNNKFYHLVLDDTDMLTKRWGRVGSEGTSSTEHTGRPGYDRTLKSKLSRGYKQTAVVTGVESSPVGGNNSHELTKAAHTHLIQPAFQNNPILDSLIDWLVKVNRHQIIESSNGLITVDTNGVMKTALGLISQDSINRASVLLAKLSKTTPARSAALLEEYLSLVPQRVPSKRGWHETFFDKNNTIESQQDLLEQLKNSLTWYEAQKLTAKQPADAEDAEDVEEKYRDLFRFNVGLLEDDRAFKQIEKMFEGSKSGFHSSSRLKLKRVYTLQDKQGLAAYESTLKRIGNEKTLWHGTRSHNVLSILRRGLYCPPVNASGTIQIQGRMFGNGLYFSSQSSKSAMYSSSGIWDGGKSENHCFMLLNNVAMGKEYHPDRNYRHGTDYIQKTGKYDSIYAKGGVASVRNDEMIVWNLDQVSTRYLCEFDA